MPVGTGANTVPLGVRPPVPTLILQSQAAQNPVPSIPHASVESKNGTDATAAAPAPVMGPALPPDYKEEKKDKERDDRRRTSRPRRSRSRDRRSRSRSPRRRSSKSRSRERRRSRRRSRSRSRDRRRSSSRGRGRRSRSRDRRRRSRSRSRNLSLQQEIDRLPAAQRDGLLAAARAGLLAVPATVSHLESLRVPRDLIKRLQSEGAMQQLDEVPTEQPAYTGPSYSRMVPSVGSAGSSLLTTAPIPMANSRMPQPPPPPAGWQPPQEATEKIGPDGKKRRSRWGNTHERAFVPGMPTVLPSNISEDQQRGYLLQLQIEELTRKLRAGELDIPPNPEHRSPSPEPVYDNRGIRLNTREVRKKQKMEQERHKLIQEMISINPLYKAPADYRAPTVRLSDKVWIPQDDYPDVNFVGLLIGPRGNTLKGLEKETGAKIIIRGKGSVKEGKVVRRDGQPLPGEDEPLHAYITSNDPEAIKRGVERIKQVIQEGLEMPEEQNHLRRMQLRELALLNGTLRPEDMQARCGNCGAVTHKTWECPERENVTHTILCTNCGNMGHIARDCKQPAPSRSLTQQTQGNQALDEEYSALMQELGQAPVRGPAPMVGGGRGGRGGYGMRAIDGPRFRGPSSAAALAQQKLLDQSTPIMKVNLAESMGGPRHHGQGFNGPRFRGGYDRGGFRGGYRGRGRGYGPPSHYGGYEGYEEPYNPYEGEGGPGGVLMPPPPPPSNMNAPDAYGYGGAGAFCPPPPPRPGATSGLMRPPPPPMMGGVPPPSGFAPPPPPPSMPTTSGADVFGAPPPPPPS